MTLFEELKNKYPIQQFALYGDCIIIPLGEFGKDYEPRLKAEGYMSHIVELQGKSKWAVQLRKAQAYTKETFPEPKPSPEQPKEDHKFDGPKSMLKGPEWDPKEKEHLLKRWPELGNITKLEKALALKGEFPRRSTNAIILKYYKLTKKPKKDKKDLEGERAGYSRQAEAQDQEEEKTRSAMFKEPPKPEQPSDEDCKTAFELLVKMGAAFTVLKEKVEALEREYEELKRQFNLHKHAEKTGEALVPL